MSTRTGPGPGPWKPKRRQSDGCRADEAVSLARRTGNPTSLASALYALGKLEITTAATDVGSLPSARAAVYLQAALTVNPYMGDDSLQPFVDAARANEPRPATRRASRPTEFRQVHAL